MNPANFSNVGGSMPGGAMPQMQMPQNNEGAQMVMNNVINMLRTQNFPGWKKDIPIQERARNIYQM